MNDPRIILQAILRIWPELPTLLGTNWADIYPELDAIHSKLEDVNEPVRQARLSLEFVSAFRKYPTAYKRLKEVLNQVKHELLGDTRKGNKPSKTQVPALSQLLLKLRNRFRASLETRYADITAPRRLTKGRRGVITVALNCESSSQSAFSQEVEVEVETLIEVRLEAHREEFSITGKGSDSPSRPTEIKDEQVISVTKYITVELNVDTEPIVFFIEGLSEGRKNLLLTFRQSGVSIAPIWLSVDVTGDIIPDEQLQSIINTLQINAFCGPPPDLEIFVSTWRRNNQIELSFVLHSPNGVAKFHNQNMGVVTLSGSPDEFQKNLMDKMDSLGARRDRDGTRLSEEQVQRKMRFIGEHLYRDLFNDQMRDAYRQFRKTVRTILITSDEPWIPWEMIRPYDSTKPEEIINDDFLCAQFQLTRWLAGRSGPPARVDVKRLVCLEESSPSGLDSLEFALAERAYISNMVKGYIGLEDASPAQATIEALGKRLDEGGVGLYHIAAHGFVKLALPDESLILLAEGQRFRPEDIDGHRMTNIERDKPLVFLNVCRGGQQGWSLTGLGGWASAWVDRGRCGVFIAPLWGVNDHLAFEFARAFYEALREGKTIGLSAQEARAFVRLAKPDRLTWIAYSIYGHPNARVSFGGLGNTKQSSAKIEKML